MAPNASKFANTLKRVRREAEQLMILGLCDDELAVSLKNLKGHCKGKSGRCCVFDQSADPAV
eukprot:CAMPEP_0173264460 /NCGR_PEP_ID=MMETSP1142-20121109/27991_1 /TAXON_ID=483371 /ORGANISM="non described non described, Strain CCMP2298" /LENGTH=61 /DNA_ID=CAMNT_0014200009 /DNA_START=193 /DNA_END=374 /DNA_ORIENTATION=+